MGCCDGWRLDESEGFVDECPSCGERTVDGTAQSGCNYSPVACKTCGSRPCDESC
jgi:hypothetical protein